MNEQKSNENQLSLGNDQEWLSTRLTLRKELQFSLSGKSGEKNYLVEDPIRSRFFQVGDIEFAFMSLLDGRRTVGEACEIMASRNEAREVDSPQNGAENENGSPIEFDESTCKTICAWLVRSCLVNSDSSASSNRLVATAEQKDQQKMMSWLNPICVRFTLLNPNRWMTQCRNTFSWMFSRWFVALGFLTACLAFFQINANWDRVASEAAGVLATDRWIWLLVGWVVLKIVHETAHGIVCRLYGGEVPQAGVLLLLFAPLAFVDVTSSWRFRKRWQRIKVASAGMYVELFLASIAVLIWCSVEQGVLSNVCYNIFLMASITTVLFNANPLMRFDGYYILADLLGVVNLYSKGQLWFRNRIQNLIFGIPKQPLSGNTRERSIVRVYGVCSFVWRILLSVSILLTASTMFHGMGLILAVIGAIFWFGLPAIQTCVVLFNQQNRHLISYRHIAMSGVASVTMVVALFYVFRAPTFKSAPAIVQYQDEEVIRAAAGGFIEKIHVKNGQSVIKNQLLVEMNNPEIMLEMDRLRTQLAQAQIQARIHHEKNELSSYQSTNRKCQSLQEQIDELMVQLNSLQIRSPINGFAFNPELENRLGSFVDEGETVITVSMKEVKEIQVAIEQNDLESIKDNIGKPVKLAFPGLRLASSRIDRLDPQATDIPPHTSLCAANGGPIPVRPVDTSTENASEDGFRMLSPRFSATIELGDQSNDFQSGQRGYVLFQSSDESLGSYLFLASRSWIRKKLEVAIGY